LRKPRINEPKRKIIVDKTTPGDFLEGMPAGWGRQSFPLFEAQKVDMV
jgi:hypothetical protein